MSEVGALGNLARRARRRAVAVRVAECALLAAAVALLCLCAARFDGAGATAAVVAAAAIGGLAAGGSWWLEKRPSAGSVARRIDTALAHGGAFVTALEVEPRAAPGSLERLLVGRVAGSLVPRAVLRTVPPPSAVLAVALLGAAALWSMLGELRVARPVAAGLAAVDQSLARASRAAAASEAGGATAAELERLRVSVEEARGQGPAEQQAALGAAEQALARLAERLAPGSELARALDDARRATRAARGGGSAADSSGAGAGSGLQNVAADRTMGGFQAAGDSAAGTRPEPGGAEAPAGSAPDEGAASASGWWNARHAEVVAGWVESRRVARSRAQAGSPTRRARNE